MQMHELEHLLTPEALQLLDELEDTIPNLGKADDFVQTVSRLRQQGSNPELVSTVLSQLRLRRKAASKFSEFAEQMLFTEAGLEQATRLAVAAQHASRFAASGYTSIADLGCGIGGDALAFSALGLAVTAVEQDEVTASVASYNLAPFPQSQVVHDSAENIDLTPFDALWFDPARRIVHKHSQKRLKNPADWSPNLDWVFDRASQRPSGIKLSPALDHELIPNNCEAQWVSDHGSVVELVLWSPGLRRDSVGRSALVITPNGTAEMTAPAATADEEPGDLEEYLYEPDGAVIRAQLIGNLARTLNAHPIDQTIAYLSSASHHYTPFAQSFRVIDVLPAKVEKLRKELAARGIGVLEIKKRGADLDPAQLRKQLKLSGPHQGTLILTRLNGQHVALLAERI